jgi:hypothetical protein
LPKYPQFCNKVDTSYLSVHANLQLYPYNNKLKKKKKKKLPIWGWKLASTLLLVGMEGQKKITIVELEVDLHLF